MNCVLDEISILEYSYAVETEFVYKLIAKREQVRVEYKQISKRLCITAELTFVITICLSFLIIIPVL